MNANIRTFDYVLPRPADGVLAGSASEEEYTSDLATSVVASVCAALFLEPSAIDFLILRTQTPDFALPTTACLVQSQAGMRRDVGAVDLMSGPANSDDSLALATGLIESGQVRNVLIVTANGATAASKMGAAEVVPVEARATFVTGEGTSSASHAFIEAVDYFVPENVLTNADVNLEFPEWSVDKIAAKTGIHSRHIAASSLSAEDLAVQAGRRLFQSHAGDSNHIDQQHIDFLIVCTQSSDAREPLSAGAIAHQLGLRTDVGTTSMNLGCSGYIYALGLAKGLSESSGATVLILTTDIYSRFMNSRDKTVRTIFGDGASATLISGTSPVERMAAVTYGTDGRGAGSLIVPNGGLRPGEGIAPAANPELRGLTSNGFDLFMDGPAIFSFTLDVVPETVETILVKAGLVLDDVDLYVFHQANAFLLEHLRKKLGIAQEKFFVSLATTGNTVSSTIPIALAEAEKSGILRPGMTVMLLGFGVGLSWGGVVLTW